jgi:hypothetical protein
MPPRLFVLNLPYFFSASKMHDVLNGCHVTSVELARTIHGVLASVETLTEEDATKAETLLNALKLPAPLAIIRGETRIGQKLGETLTNLTETAPRTYSDVA